MATDLQNRPDQDSDPIQGHYDTGFNTLNHAEHPTDDGGEPTSNEAVGADSLRQAEEAGTSLYNPGGDSAQAGSTTGSKETAGQGSLYNEGGDGSHGRLGAARSKFAAAKATAGRNKLLVGGMVGGGASLFGLLLLFILVAGSLKIPHLAQNITIYQFARLSRQYAQSAESVTAEKAALDAIPATAANDSAWAATKAKYTETTGKVKDTWAKLDKYRPDKVTEQLKTQNNLKFNYVNNAFGRPQLKGVTFNDSTVVKVKPGYSRFVPVYGSVLDFKSNLQLSRQIGPDVQAAMRANEVGPIVRSSVAKNLRQELGIGLVAWKLGSYENKDARQARIQNVKDLQRANSNNLLPDEAVTEPVKNAVADVEAAEASVLASDELIGQAIEKGGVAPSVKASIGDALAKSGVTTALGVINPVYAVALPMCIVYDGSLERSGPTIDNAVKQQQATYYFIASAADQEKNGSPPNNNTTELATAVQGLNDNLGDVSQSNAVTRANAGTVSTANTLSPEASAGGNFTILNAVLGGNSAAAGTINFVGDHLCPVLTDTKVVVGIGIVSIVATFFTGGAAGGVEEGAAAAAGRAATAVTDRVAESLVSRLASKAGSAAGRSKELLGDITKSTVKIVGATLVAKMIVASKAHQFNSSLAQGADLANIADSGGNLTAGEICRHGLYCRALTSPEIADSNQTDAAYLAYQNESKSVYDRYLSTSNVGSLVSKVGMSIGSSVRGSIVQSMAHMVASMFRPALVTHVLSHSFTGVAHAEAVDTTYQNVQFGWSKSENALIDSSESYKMLENQRILDASGYEDAISSRYDKCFTASLGTLLSNPDNGISRDENGNVDSNSGLCSPAHLGPNNTDKDAGCGSGGCGDLVFRWRLAHRYETVLNQLTGIQNAPAST